MTAEALLVAGAVTALLAAAATSVFFSVFWQAVNSNADIVRGNIDNDSHLHYNSQIVIIFLLFIRVYF